MNRFLKESIQYAQQRNYLDDLYKVYPTAPNGLREVDLKVWSLVEKSFHRKNNKELISNLLNMELFPIKNSYVAFLRRDKRAIDRNSATIDRLAEELYSMGLDKIFENCTVPKEANRQIGPMFKDWVRTQALGVAPLRINDFMRTNGNAVLDASDAEMKSFAESYLNYYHDKGLDFLARINGKYIIGEAKFLTDFGGHQNAQFQDAISVLKVKDVKAVNVAILDGVLYIKGNTKMYRSLWNMYKEENIMSALLLRNFLYSI